MCTESQLKDWMEHLAHDSCHLNLIPNRFTAHHCTLRFYHFDGFFRGELAHKNLEIIPARCLVHRLISLMIVVALTAVQEELAA